MKNSTKILAIAVLFVLVIPCVGIGIKMLKLNRQAIQLINQSNGVAIGMTKTDVLAAMPANLLVSIDPPTADEVASSPSAISALHYNAPVFMNSVYILMLFDDNDHLIAMERHD